VFKLLRAAFAASVIVAGSQAQASWNVAKSKHFVIYANANPNVLRGFANKLEYFDQAVRLATHSDDPTVGDGNRLTVFVMPSVNDVRALAGDKIGFLYGFYTGRVEGSLAYVANEALTSDDENAVLYHEYTHHLMMEDIDRPYPEWYVEGFAEFFSTPRFQRDGVWLGVPVESRAWGLYHGPKMPVANLFAGMQPNMTKEQKEVFYGRSWLLAHYLLLEKPRQGQLTNYVDAIAQGATPLAAGTQVFGDLSKLDRELDQYMSRPMTEFKIGVANMHVSPIDVQPLSEGASQVVLIRAKLKKGAKGADAEALAAQLRPIEARYRGDLLVESTLAEAELDAGNADAAEAAATRAVAANPADTEALVLKGRGLEAQAHNADGDARKVLFEKARDTFIAANKLDTEDPEPLNDFYWSFLDEGERPNANAIAALHYASDLAPQDIGVRMNSAIAFLEEGKLKDARSTLAVVAYSPHAEQAAVVAKRMMADIDAGNGRAALAEAHISSPPQAGR